MISFFQYLLEASNVNSGNYVCAYTGKPNVPESLLPKSGTVPKDKYHITLMYSPESNVDQRIIQNALTMVPDTFDLDFDSAACFDSIPKEGERDENKATLVLKVKSPMADHLHMAFKNLGMTHTYAEYSPHVTLSYNVDRDEAYEYAGKLNQWLINQYPRRLTLGTTSYESKPIDTDWVSKL